MLANHEENPTNEPTLHMADIAGQMKARYDALGVTSNVEYFEEGGNAGLTIRVPNDYGGENTVFRANKMRSNPLGWLTGDYSIAAIDFINIPSSLRRGGHGRDLIQLWEHLISKNMNIKTFVASNVKDSAREFWKKLGYHELQGTDATFVKTFSPAPHSGLE